MGQTGRTSQKQAKLQNELTYLLKTLETSRKRKVPDTSRNGHWKTCLVKMWKTSRKRSVPHKHTHRHSKCKDIPVEDVEDQQQHVWNDGSG